MILFLFLLDVSIENTVTMRIAHTFTMHTAPLFIYVLIDYFGQIQIVILHEEVQRGRLEETRVCMWEESHRRSK